MTRRLRTLGRGAAVAALLAGAHLVTATPAAAIEPHTKAELAAIQVRVLQTEMMVAALTCDFHQQYNAVIQTYGRELTQHASVLKTMFRRQHGGSAQHALDVYVTQLANDASMRSIRSRRTFCVTADALFQTALSSDATLAQVGGGLIQQAAASIAAGR